jgi:hypothetical protein
MLHCVLAYSATGLISERCLGSGLDAVQYKNHSEFQLKAAIRDWQAAAK